MKNITRILIVALILLLQPKAKSQNSPVLQQVGTLDSIYSKNLKVYRNFYVQLPTDYHSDPNKKYPVAFILDGEVLLPTVHNVQSFYSGGFTPEMVLIGIVNDKNRTRDLTTSKITERYGMPYTEENGEAEEFLKFIETELIPHIENEYRVTSFRTLIGHSYAGLFTVYTLINHPWLFTNYLAIDPSLDWDNQQILSQAKEKLSTENYKGKSLFASLSGQLHRQNSDITIDNVMKDTTDYTMFPRANIAFYEMVEQNKENGLSFDWKFYPNDLHGTVPFPSIMDGLISTFSWYQMENTDKINSFDTTKEALLGIIKNREKKLSDHFGYPVPPYPEDLLNMLGYMNMEMEKPEKAKMCFELAIAYYPESANVYDSMADYYERNNDLDSALKFVEKAYSISESDYYKQRMEKLKAKK